MFKVENIESFRPLIRGFFFYLMSSLLIVGRFSPVSVPSFGDSFFIRGQFKAIIKDGDLGFRPLIRGFFFYKRTETPY